MCPSRLVYWDTDGSHQANEKIREVIALSVGKPRILQKCLQIKSFTIIYWQTISIAEVTCVSGISAIVMSVLP